MDIKFTKKTNTLIVKFDGELDHHIADQLKEKIDKEYNTGFKNLIFDLKNVNFMDSSGIGVIIGRYKKAKEKNGKVVLVNANSQLNKIIEISGLMRIIKCYNSIEEALKSM
ncbi:MAG: anti-sigma F factor antagonist [Thermoanaerobacteraceae bacterium]